MGLSVIIDVTEDIVGSNGFSIQLNAYAATNEEAAYQQYIIYLEPNSNQLHLMVDNYKVNGELINYQPVLATLPSQKLPAGYQLQIILKNDASGNITGVTFVVIDNNGNTLANQPVNLLSLKLDSGSPVTQADLSPIIAFQLNIVTAIGVPPSFLSSGAGKITYTASSPMAVLTSEPSCAEVDVGTWEAATSCYGQLPSSPSQTFTQSFQAASAHQPMIFKKGKFIQARRNPLKA